MMKKSAFISISMLLSFGSFAGLAPLSLPEAQKQVTAYYTSGTYNNDIQTYVDSAINKLRGRLAHKGPDEKLAIVSDIDDTVLSSQPTNASIKYGYYAPYFDAAVKKATFPAITPMKELMAFAKKNNITVFYVTGRKEHLKNNTEKNLAEQGFTYYQEIYFKPNDYKESSAVPHKVTSRKAITEMGYSIVLNIGDQLSDIQGGYAEHGIKLPNYMYHIP